MRIHTTPTGQPFALLPHVHLLLLSSAAGADAAAGPAHTAAPSPPVEVWRLECVLCHRPSRREDHKVGHRGACSSRYHTWHT